MSDITNPKLLYCKAIAFLLCGALAAAGIFIELPSFRIALMLCIAIWCFCRAYYFAFYVIEHYVDPRFRFAGLVDFLRYALRTRRR